MALGPEYGRDWHHQPRHHPGKLRRQPANAIFANDKIGWVQRVVLKHKQDFGIDDGPHGFDNVENECRPTGQRDSAKPTYFRIRPRSASGVRL